MLFKMFRNSTPNEVFCEFSCETEVQKVFFYTLIREHLMQK